jgi:hypothetical protein
MTRGSPYAAKQVRNARVAGTTAVPTNAVTASTYRECKSEIVRG